MQRHLWSDACANNLNGAARRSELVADRCGQLRSEVVMLLVRDAEEDNARSSGELLTETLLVDSDTARAVAGDLGIRLADRWMVAAVLDPEAAGQLGRKDELVSFHKGICCVLVAITGDDDGGSALRVAEATCAAVVGLAGPAGTEELQSALRRATDIVSLGHAAGLTGVVTEFDVLVEESAATDAEVSARLSAIVARLDEAGARLVETLISFYANDMSRTRTACALGVHRSTLEYRFKRIRQLTGFCPASTRGVVLFSTALTVAQVL
ncbi:helix-turn-helix domain-containing protein [Streptomyces sp. ID05-26A]|nr:helix-turn-helix domain-containing protein [Streptomyces sp. ID05-26A]